MNERIVMFGPDRGLMGVLTEPPAGAPTVAGPTAILFNAGFLPRMGPNRLHVRMARELARRGFPVLRFDFAGLGDSPVSRSKDPATRRHEREAGEAVGFVVDELGARGVVPIGMCTGAGLAYHLAVEDARVVGAVAINGGLVDAAPSLELLQEAQSRLEARYYRRQMGSPSRWLRVLRGKSNLGTIARTAKRVILPRPAAAGPGPDVGLAELDRLQSCRAPILAICADGSLAWDLLCMAYGPEAEELQELPNVELSFLPACDHVFTPRWAQSLLLDGLCQWFERQRTHWADGQGVAGRQDG